MQENNNTQEKPKAIEVMYLDREYAQEFVEYDLTEFVDILHDGGSVDINNQWEVR